MQAANLPGAPTMRSVIQLAVACAAILALTSSPRAAHDLETAALPDASLELVVIEAEGCIYCQIFRRDVLPSYRASPRSRVVPLRFVDLNQPEADRLAIKAPIDVVPTAILMKDHREVGRIDGYVGPEAFFHSVNRLLAGVE